MTALPWEAAQRAWGGYDIDDPFPVFREAREHGPVHQVTLVDGHTAWLIVDFEHAKAALNDPRFSKDMHAALASSDDVVAEGLPGPAFAKHMLAVDPPDHTRLRRLVSGAFSPRRVEALRPHIEAIVDELLNAIEAAGPDHAVDLIAAYAFPLPFTVICELLGVAQTDRARLGQAFVTLLSPTPTDEAWGRAKAASDVVVGMLTDLVHSKQADPTDDLVSALIDARDDDGGDSGDSGEGRLTEQELLSTIFQLFVAGHDTTASLIGNGLVALFRHPDQLDALRADPSRLPAAIEELLRFDAPVPHATFRFATEDVEIAGVTVPNGAQVLISLAAANRDAQRFDDAESLDIDRVSSRHLAFGHGIHFCLGAPLARIEGHIAFASLFERFPHLRLAVPFEDLHWSHGDGLVLRGLAELPVLMGASRTRPA